MINAKTLLLYNWQRYLIRSWLHSNGYLLSLNHVYVTYVFSLPLSGISIILRAMLCIVMSWVIINRSTHHERGRVGGGDTGEGGRGRGGQAGLGPGGPRLAAGRPLAAAEDGRRHHPLRRGRGLGGRGQAGGGGGAALPDHTLQRSTGDIWYYNIQRNR